MTRQCFMQFEKLAEDGKARRARLTFPRGTVETPAFMPVGTYGTVKGMTPKDIEATGAQIILGNTFHLMLRPGTEIIKQHGDLHDFMQWKGPILTDSGGFQVFSLGKMRKITEKGVTFQSPVNGSKVFMGPEESMQVQRELGSDIVMIFDECTPYPATELEAAESMRLSLRWAKRSKDAHGDNPSALFGIVQGGCIRICVMSLWLRWTRSVLMVMPLVVYPLVNQKMRWLKCWIIWRIKCLRISRAI